LSMSTTGRSVAAAAAAARRAATPVPLPSDPAGTRDAATRCALAAVRGAVADPETLATAIVNDAILDVGVRGARGARRVRRAVPEPRRGATVETARRLSRLSKIAPSGWPVISGAGTCRFSNNITHTRVFVLVGTHRFFKRT